MSTGGLRVGTHLRGHVASCNGRVELVRARAEPHSQQDGESCFETQELQARAEEIRKQKEERLLTFQRDVKERVQRRERARQKQLSEAASKPVLKEKQPSARAPGVRRRKVWNTGMFNHKTILIISGVWLQGRTAAVCEREEVEVVVIEPSTAVQRARQSLLAASNPTPCHPPQPRPTPPDDFGSAVDELPSRTATPVSPPSEERSAVRKYTAPSQLELRKHQSHARQLHLFRRLYSDLERETTRQRRVRQALRGCAERRRRENEVQRRMVEEGLVGEDSVLSAGSSLGAEVERLEEWEQTVALERRRHQLQTVKEAERYVEALRAQLRERLASYPTPPPPLCSCGSTLWDTDPLTCANNCPFYQNPRGNYCYIVLNLAFS